MRKLILVIAVFVMGGIIVGAFAMDSVRLTLAARERVADADEALKTAEIRLVRTLSAWGDAPESVRSAIQAYQAAKTPEERRGAYDGLVAATLQAITSQPPIATTKDDIAGAINRRVVAERPFNEVKEEYDRWLKTTRGRLGGQILDGSH